MGYYITQDTEKSTFFLPAAQKAAALESLKKMEQDEPDRFYFIDWDELDKATSLEDALAATRWKCECEEGGDVVGLTFAGQKLGGKEWEVFYRLARAGAVGEVHMAGDDGYVWAYVLKDGDMSEIYGRRRES